MADKLVIKNVGTMLSGDDGSAPDGDTDPDRVIEWLDHERPAAIYVSIENLIPR